MLFTCPGAAARGGNLPTAKGGRRHFCIDVHCHVHYPPADEMVKHAFSPDAEPGVRFSNDLSRATNKKQMENVFVCLTSVEERLRDMDKMGVDVQAISVSPFQFKYALDPELGAKAARATNENLAAIVQQHPSRFVALANVPLQAPDAAAAELEYLRQDARLPRGGDRDQHRRQGDLPGPRSVLGEGAGARRDGVHAPERLHGRGPLSDHYFNNVIGNPLDSTVAIAHLVFDGVLERFPRLKIVSAHGGGYVSHYPGRMDHVWGARVDARTVLKRTPRQSLAKLYFDTIVFDRDQLRHLVSLWGVDHIVVGTDYPYDMGWYDPRGFIEGCGFLKDADKAKILGGNAARLLKITSRLASMGRNAAPASKRPAAKGTAKK